MDFPESFLIGHAVIDGDHRRLIAYINKIKDCFAKKLGAEAKETCMALQRFMNEHMEREEKILHDAVFPRLEEHIEFHDRIAEKCRAVLAGCNNACLRNEAEDCTTGFFVDIIEHIVGGDLNFKSYLQAQGVTEPTN